MPVNTVDTETKSPISVDIEPDETDQSTSIKDDIEPSQSDPSMPIKDVTPPELLGKEIGNYRIIDLVGVGTWSAVYLGEDIKTGGKAIVRVLDPAIRCRRDDIQRFFNEVRIVNRLGHQSIARLYDFGESDEIGAYLVQEYLDGETLEDRLQRQRRLTPAAAIRLIHHVAAPLAAAHQQGVVHAALTPANIYFLPDSGEPGDEPIKIVGFGLSTLMVADRPMDALRYVAPERCRGGTGDRRSDVYSLGVIAFEALSGKPPFSSDSAEELIQKHLEEEPPRLDEMGKLPDKVVAAVTKALAKDPEARFQTVTELAEALPAKLPPIIPVRPKPASTTPIAAEPPKKKVPLRRALKGEPLANAVLLTFCILGAVYLVLRFVIFPHNPQETDSHSTEPEQIIQRFDSRAAQSTAQKVSTAAPQSIPAKVASPSPPPAKIARSSPSPGKTESEATPGAAKAKVPARAARRAAHPASRPARAAKRVTKSKSKAKLAASANSDETREASSEAAPEKSSKKAKGKNTESEKPAPAPAPSEEGSSSSDTAAERVKEVARAGGGVRGRIMRAFQSKEYSLVYWQSESYLKEHPDDRGVLTLQGIAACYLGKDELAQKIATKLGGAEKARIVGACRSMGTNLH